MSKTSELEKVQAIIEKHGKSKDKLIQIMLDLQSCNEFNYLPEEWVRYAAQELDYSFSKVYETISFYAMFNLKPKGKYVIEICKSAPCHVSGANSLVDMLEKALGVKIGETTEDNVFSLNTTSCFGACDIAPAIKIGEKVYGNLNEEKLKELLDSYREVQ
ncbi:NADP-reducing hydrogenase subunit HndA [Oxobacter pfennigii]|uniref:NADP-reducing hydrogenase subunit HndA n=1 Tax=Oxobacter pfennigii TaxID=36849 RepID=A0A0P8WC69_9CLOT|nr:NAD(P)H-dependent oxidoreductase subunit E [Oxobacter pfennigii]KPU46347.1 NADP-reducing hydrogenase subunit HndA [Oxobacter pfennigii]